MYVKREYKVFKKTMRIYEREKRGSVNMEENIIKKQLEEFHDELSSMKNVDGLLKNVKSYLGKVDAVKEWNDNSREAYKRFLHTQSYCDFIDEDALILLGRTGTGKTSILRSLCENVNLKRINLYDIAITAQFNEVLENLIDVVDDFNSPVINSQLVKIISMYINCYVMKALIDQNNCADTTSAMYSYIKSNHLYDLGDPRYVRSGMNKIQNMLKASKQFSGKTGEVANGIATVADIISAFTQNGYEEAYKEMMDVLQNKRVLVLVDTLNEYDLRDARIVLCVKALIATCFEYYNNTATNNVFVKISIPSEIHTHLIEQLPGKQQGNTVVIQWTNNDLLKLIAIRLLAHYEDSKKEVLQFKGRYKYEDFYDDNVNATCNAKEMLYEILPKTCPTSLEFSFDTLAYCIRHTLKKPRELMLIFNFFLAKIYEEKNSQFFIDNPNEIRNMIHSTQEEMISSALSMYTTSYKEIKEACEIVLQGRTYYFQGKELERKLKEAAINRQGYDINDIKRILLESGLIGKISEISSVNVKEDEDSKNRKYTMQNSIRIIKAKFEYQVKGRLSLNRNDYYVLHPMCYEHFECKVGSQTLVYPDEFGDEAEVMKSVQLKQWAEAYE